MREAKHGEGFPKFAGEALRHLPVPAAEVWVEEEFGSAVLAEYQERVRLDFDENPFLKVFKLAGGIVHGSNPFGVVLVDMIVRPAVRVATPPDLQAILVARRQAAALVEIHGGYKDAALALRSVKEPNSYLAENLRRQLPARMEWPVVVYLSGLRLVKDPLSPCSLSFELTSKSRYFSAPILDEKSGHFDDANVDGPTGLPAKMAGTARYFYSTEEGMSRVYLGRGLSIDTIWDELGNSQADGRVVFCDNSVPPELISDYIKRLDAATALLEK